MAYPPHITLAVYDTLPANLLEVFDEVASALAAQTITFHRLGFFETPEAYVVWAAPHLPELVKSAHRELHGRIGAEQSRPHYRPGHWVPHCSLATTIPRTKHKEVLDLVSQPLGETKVRFDYADCASFLPVDVLKERVLASEPHPPLEPHSPSETP